MDVIYPGSFDPPTMGHFHIIERSSRLFEKVIVLVAVNPDKKYWLDLEKRESLMEELCKDFKNVEIARGEGLLISDAKRLGATAVIKGVRHQADLENERIMAEANRKMSDGLETLFFFSRGEYMEISSSLVRQIYLLNGDISPFVPKIVLEELR